MALTLRETAYKGVAAKGTALSHAELDQNQIFLDTPTIIMLNVGNAVKTPGGGAWANFAGFNKINSEINSGFPDGSLAPATGLVTIPEDGLYELTLRLRTNTPNHKLVGFRRVRASTTPALDENWVAGTEINADTYAVESSRVMAFKKGDQTAPKLFTTDQQDVTLAANNTLDVDNYFVIRKLR